MKEDAKGVAHTIHEREEKYAQNYGCKTCRV
jgi:hypothetical protein